MPMFIITGSMMSAAILSPSASSSRSSAPASLNGTTRIQSAIPAGTPLDFGVAAGVSRPPMTSAPGSTEYISWSTWPWYEPSIFAITSRPVAARATRMAEEFDSVPELQNRTWSTANRRHSSSASATVVSTVTAKCTPLLAAWVIASATTGWAWPTAIVPNPLWKSKYSLPSASHTWAPFPRSR